MLFFSWAFLEYLLTTPFAWILHIREHFLDYATDTFINTAQFIGFISSVGGFTYFLVPVVAAAAVIISGAVFARRRGTRFWPIDSYKKSNLFSHGHLGYGKTHFLRI